MHAAPPSIICDSRVSKSDILLSPSLVAFRAVIVPIYAVRRHGGKLLALLASSGTHQVSSHTARSWLRGAEPSAMSLEILSARYQPLADKIDQERAVFRALMDR